MAFSEHRIEWDNDKVGRLWNYYSRTPPYSDIYFSKLFGAKMLRLSGLPLNRPLAVLDFGCGPGHLWDHLRSLRAKWSYTGLDFSADSVEALERKADGAPQFKGAHHVSELPSRLGDASFDAVLLFEVVEHLSDEHLRATLAEVQRVLKPGGVLVVSTPNAEDLQLATLFCPDCGAVFHQWQHIRSWTTDSLSAEVCRHGFLATKIMTLDFTVRGVRGFVTQMARRWLLGRSIKPHMIASFCKTSLSRPG